MIPDAIRQKRILMVVAHPDDEIICGWPILQEHGTVAAILSCTSDRHNPERQWCANRSTVLKGLCNQHNIECSCLDYNSGFYRLPTRDETLSRALAEIRSRIEALKPDIIFTHNPLGEYGHIDHILVHQVVMSLNIPVLLSDMFIPSNWVPYRDIGRTLSAAYFHAPVAACRRDPDLYAVFENAYRTAGVWTWSTPPADNCSLYLVDTGRRKP